MDEAESRLTERAHSVPVYGEFDLFVAGGGIAGVAAAISASRSGLKVFLAEENAFLGREVTGGFRIHTRGAEGGWGAEVLERLSKLNAYRDGCIDAPAMTVLLDKLIVEAGGIRPMLRAFTHELIVEGNRVRGAVVTSRSGRFAVLAPKVIDATEEGVLAASVGAATKPIAPGGPAGDYAFLMSFVGEGDTPAEIEIPEKQPHAGARAEVFRTLWPGERLVRFEIEKPAGGKSFGTKAGLEILGRELAVAFASYLRKSVPAFARAAMTASAWCALRRPDRQFTGRVIESGEEPLCRLMCRDGSYKAVYASQLMPPGIEGLTVVSGASDIGAEAAEALLDFAGAAELGEKAGALCARHAVTT